jgi:alkylhydroperoxidase family enzyme
MTVSEAPPRIAPVQPPYDPVTEMLLAKWMPPGSPVEPLLLFRTLMRHHELASRMLPLGAGILGHGCVEPRDREILIHRTCARAGAEYEWGVHAVAFGRPLGLSDEQIHATVHGDADDPAWSERDSLLIGLADELHESCDVSEELWAALAQHFSEDQLLELLVIAGQYRLISYVLNGVRVQRESWAERFPSPDVRVPAPHAPQA